MNAPLAKPLDPAKLTDPADFRLAVTLYRQKLREPGPQDVPLEIQVETLEADLAYLQARLDARARKDKVPYGVAVWRKRVQHAVMDTMRKALAEQQRLEREEAGNAR